MTAETLARAHQRARERIVGAVAAEAARLWADVPANNLGAWARSAARLFVILTGAQQAVAQAADDYLTAVLTAQGIDPASNGRVAPGALAGVASDGRDLGSLLERPLIVTRTVIGRGVPVRAAVASGGAALDMIVRTQVADAGRAADQTALVARPAVAGYTRMVVGKTCARCILLAGNFYRWNKGFRRHPRCDCVHIPTSENLAGDLRTNPRAAFDAMTAAEQDKAFTKAGAEAIRAGADVGQVVNARRGMYEAGGRLLTRESTSRRGVASRGRPMPEEIFRQAKGSRDEAIRLLRLHRYLI